MINFFMWLTNVSVCVGDECWPTKLTGTFQPYYCRSFGNGLFPLKILYFPYILHGDTSLVKHVKGLSPNRLRHDFNLDIYPVRVSLNLKIFFSFYCSLFLIQYYYTILSNHITKKRPNYLMNFILVDMPIVSLIVKAWRPTIWRPIQNNVTHLPSFIVALNEI